MDTPPSRESLKHASGRSTEGAAFPSGNLGDTTAPLPTDRARKILNAVTDTGSQTPCGYHQSISTAVNQVSCRHGDSQGDGVAWFSRQRCSCSCPRDQSGDASAPRPGKSTSWHL
ncbi:hypothetical protein DPEC_G00170000 [Dallia pectoralis]|uniref:Uncharacterized protein n=1 Tax=Dallia pectoralis TaxID=75939 RepID=A0ACC2GD13_DALPE|nr:hypothetical protein DPEC_G00170000 [Dallia pectoralis]